MNRRQWITAQAATLVAGATATADEPPLANGAAPLTITAVKVTPIALPDPPLLAASGCHGPYFLRNIIELHTDGGIVGIGELTVANGSPPRW